MKQNKLIKLNETLIQNQPPWVDQRMWESPYLRMANSTSRPRYLRKQSISEKGSAMLSGLQRYGLAWRLRASNDIIYNNAIENRLSDLHTQKKNAFHVTKSIYEAGRRFLKWFIKSEPKILSNSCSKAKSTPVKGNKDSKLVFRITNESYTDRSIRSPSSAVKFLEMTTV